MFQKAKDMGLAEYQDPPSQSNPAEYEKKQEHKRQQGVSCRHVRL